MTDEQIRELYKRMSGQVSPTPELLEDTREKNEKFRKFSL